MSNLFAFRRMACTRNVQPGTWRPVRVHPETGERSAIICCPDCARDSTLTTHKIDDEGRVKPSVVCPHDGCGFHEFARLEGWASYVESIGGGA